MVGSVAAMTERHVVAGHEVEVRRIPATRPGSPTLVFLHEALGCLALWRDFPDRVAAATGWGAVIGSRWGYGRSERRPAPWPFDYHEGEATRDLPALLAALGVERHVLWGHSDGATIALLNAALAPGDGLLGVVSVAGHVVVEAEGPGSMAVVADRFHHGDLRDRLAKYHDDVDTVFGEWVRIWTDPGFADWDIRPQLGAIAVPTLVAQGADDEYATPGHVGLIREAVGPTATPLLVPGCGHQPMFEATETMVAATEQFCGSVLD